MKTTKWLSITLAAALNIGGWMATPSLAADGAAPVTPRGRISQRIAEKLNLTEDQKAQIKTVLRGEKDALTALLGHPQQVDFVPHRRQASAWPLTVSR